MLPIETNKRGLSESAESFHRSEDLGGDSSDDDTGVGDEEEQVDCCSTTALLDLDTRDKLSQDRVLSIPANDRAHNLKHRS